MKNKFRKALPFMLAASLALGVAPGVGAVVSSETAEAASIEIKKSDGNFFYIPGGEANSISYSIGGKGTTELYPCYQNSEKNENQITTGASSNSYYVYVIDPKGQITSSVIPSAYPSGDKYIVSLSVSNLNNQTITVKGRLPFCKHEDCNSKTHPLSERIDRPFDFNLTGVRGQVSDTYDLEILDNNNFVATYDIAGSFPNMPLYGGASLSDSPASLGITYQFSGSKLILKGGNGNFKMDTPYSFQFRSTTGTNMPVSIASNTFSLTVSKKQVGSLSKSDVVPYGVTMDYIDLPKLPRGVKLSDYKTITLNGNTLASGNINQHEMYPRLKVNTAFTSNTDYKLAFKDSRSCSDFEMYVTVTPQKLDAYGLTGRNVFNATGTFTSGDVTALNPGAVTKYGLLNTDVLESGDRPTVTGIKISNLTNGRDITNGKAYDVTWNMPSLSSLSGKYNVPNATTISGTLNVYNSVPTGFTVLSDNTADDIIIYPENSTVPRNLYFEVQSKRGEEVTYQWYLDGSAIGNRWGVARGKSAYLNIEDLGAFMGNGSEADNHTIYCEAKAGSETIKSGILKFGTRYVKALDGGIGWDNSAGISGGGGVTAGGGGSTVPMFVTENSKDGETANTTGGGTGNNTAAEIKAYQAQYSHDGAGTPSKMHRLVSISSGEHLFTTNQAEVNNLLKNGWKSEEIKGKTVGEKTGDPVYRVFNPVTMEHLYTMSLKEKSYLVSEQKWRYEGIQFFSGGKTALTRLYNPKAVAYNSHLLTSDQNEIKTLMARGWINEGLTWSLDEDDK